MQCSSDRPVSSFYEADIPEKEPSGWVIQCIRFPLLAELTFQMDSVVYRRTVLECTS